MILCDIGNFAAKFYDDGKTYNMAICDFLNFNPSKKIFYINVNDSVINKIKSNRNFIDLEPYFKIDTIYKGMGIDRIAACHIIKDGIVVDAGSAITVDIMARNTHLGGFIMPGISSYLDAYEKISKRLKIVFNSQIDIQCLPLRTTDAVTYGIVTPIVLSIKNIAKNKRIYFTGGDGHFFSKFFDNAIYDKNLIFRSMLDLINNKDLL